MLLTKDINLTVNLKEKLDPAPCSKKELIKNRLRNIIFTSAKYTSKQKWHMRENKIKNKLKLTFFASFENRRNANFKAEVYRFSFRFRRH